MSTPKNLVLRDYQQEALASIENHLNQGVTKQVIVLATGGGKTVLFSHVPQLVSGKMLVVAHRAELIHQAVATLKKVNPESTISIDKANDLGDLHADIVVASVQTLLSNTRLTRYPRDHFASLVADEVHHYSSPKWQAVLDYFDVHLRLGVTATPQRSDGKRLTDVFDQIVFYKPMNEMIEEGYLCPLVGHTISTNVDLSGVPTRAGDYAVGALSKAVNIKARNDLAVEAYTKFSGLAPTLVFCVDVEHAYAMAQEFRDHGISSAAVDGKTPDDERKAILDDFRAGRIRVLTNCSLFTEGTDIPQIGCVILARPTKSQVFLTQAVGRGLRTAVDKNHCVFIDLADQTTKLKVVGLPTLMGLPADFKLEGDNLSAVATEYEKLKETSPSQAAMARSLDDITHAWKQIDMFTVPQLDPTLAEFTSFVWVRTGSDTYTLNLSDNEQIIIEGDVLGRYTAQVRKDGEFTHICTTVELLDTFQQADEWIIQNRRHSLSLIDTGKSWREDSPTKKQLKWLKKFNVPVTTRMSKGDASAILDKIFKENPKQETKRPRWLEEKIAQAQRDRRN